VANSSMPSSCRLNPKFAERHIFQDGVARDVAGANVRALQEVCMVRRGYGTVINGQKVGAGLPRLVKRSIDVGFSSAAQVLHEKYSKKPLSKLMRAESPPSNKLTWNQKNFRHLVLLTSWLGFEAILDEVKSSKPKLQAMKSEGLNLLHKWLVKVQKHRQQQGLHYDVPEKSDRLGMMARVCEEAPEIKAMLALAGDEGVTHEENIVVWTQFPAQQILLWLVLLAIGQPVDMISSDMSPEDREQVIVDFNSPSKKPRVLVLSYGLSSCGLNLHHASHITLHFDTPISKPVGDQANGRQGRLGAHEDVIVYTLGVTGTFNDRQYTNSLAKALPSVITELNEDLFAVKVTQDDVGDFEVSVGEFVRADGRITPYGSDMHRNASRVAAVTTTEIADALLDMARGRPVEIFFDD